MRIEEFDDNSLRIVYDDDGKISRLIDRQGNTVLQPVGTQTNPLTGRLRFPQAVRLSKSPHQWCCSTRRSRSHLPERLRKPR